MEIYESEQNEYELQRINRAFKMLVECNRTIIRAKMETEILNALRGVSELVFALVFVSAVGLGPFPGVLALALHNAGMLGKFYAEAIEAVDTGPVEAVTATGARWSQG
jgi:ABC-type arginine transport system permease subunit